MTGHHTSTLFGEVVEQFRLLTVNRKALHALTDRTEDLETLQVLAVKLRELGVLAGAVELIQTADRIDLALLKNRRGFVE